MMHRNACPYLIPVLFTLSACVVEGTTPDPGPAISARDPVSPLPAANLVAEPVVTSIEDFDHAVRVGANPFHLLAHDPVSRLRDSLVFENGRVVAMDYREVRSRLPPDRYLDLMYAFGFEHSDHPAFAGIAPPHPSAPRPGRDYCVLHGPAPLEAASPPPAIPDADALALFLDRGQGVIARLSPEALQEIHDTARFNERGLTSFRFARSKDELAPEDYEALLAMFGMQAGDGVEGYYCAARGSCKKSEGWLCNLRRC